MEQVIKIRPYNSVFYKLDTDPGTLRLLWDKFRVRKTNYQFHPKYKAGIWDGYIPFVNMRNATVGRGLLDLLKEYAETCDIVVDDSEVFENDTYTRSSVEEYIKSLNVVRTTPEGNIVPIQFFDYQIEMVCSAILRRRSVLEAATSAGKSLGIYGFVRWFLDHNLGKKIVVIVPRTSLVEQMESDFKDYSKANGFDVDGCVHKLYSGKEKDTDKSILITTWQSLKNFDDKWYNDSDMYGVLVDECHTCSANVLKDILSKLIYAEYRIGTTGTIPKPLEDKYTLFSMIGTDVKIVKAHELIETNRASPVEITCCLLKYDQEICKMVNPSKSAARKNGKSGSDIFREECDFVFTSDKRKKFITKLTNYMTGNTLILSSRLDVLDGLEEEFKNKYPEKKLYRIDGKTEVEDREKTRQIINLEEDNSVLLGSTQCVSTGINLPRIHNIVFATGTKAFITLSQAIGRGLRKADDKDVCKVFDIVDDLRFIGKSGNERKNYMFNHFEERIVLYSDAKFPFKVLNFKI